MRAKRAIEQTVTDITMVNQDGIQEEIRINLGIHLKYLHVD